MHQPFYLTYKKLSLFFHVLCSLSSALVQSFVNMHMLLEPHHHQWQLQPLSTSIALFMNVSKQSWLQAQLSLHRGGLSLLSLSHHSTAAYISSLCNSKCASPNHLIYLASSIDSFNIPIMSSDTISIESCFLNKSSQHSLSDKLEAYSFSLLFDSMSCAHRARLLSVSSPHAAAWLTVTPSVSLGLHLDPNELHTAMKWWLRLCPYGAIDVPTPSCALCPEKALDPLCHHSITFTCKRGSDVTNRSKQSSLQYCLQCMSTCLITCSP